MTRAHELLPELYHAALKLPTVKPPGYVDEDEDEPDDERWWAAQDDLREVLGDADHYSDVFDPIQPEARASTWSLADDLADIYRDLREGLDLAEKEGSVSPARVIWAWRFDWEHHWGRHALGALRALYARLTDYYARRPAEPPAPEA
jgi:Domain of unknown function (DUF5063)